MARSAYISPGKLKSLGKYIEAVDLAVRRAFAPGPTAAEIAAGVTPVDFRYIEFNVKRYGAKGDGITDDTDAIQAGLDVVKRGGLLYFPRGIYRVSDTLILNLTNLEDIPVEIAGEARASILYFTGGAKTCLLTKGFRDLFRNTNHTIRDLTLAGQGSATTGHLLEIQAPAAVVLHQVSFVGHGGRALQLWGERVVGYSLRFSNCRQAMSTGRQALNECYFYDTHILEPGYAQDMITPNGEASNAYSYNVNAVNGVFPTSPTELTPETRAAIGWNGAQNVAFIGGSIKPLTHLGAFRFPQKMEQTSLRQMYIEAYTPNAINPSVIYGGLCETTTLETAIDANDTSLVGDDFKWFLATTGSPDTDQYGMRDPLHGVPCAIYPPDYDSTSSSASSIGGGILQNDFEFVNARYIDITTNTMVVYSRGFNSTTAKAWPAGAIISEQPGYTDRNTSVAGDLILLDTMHISSPQAANAGVTVNHDPDTGRIYGTIVLGVARDIFNDPWESTNGHKGVTLLNTRRRAPGSSKIYSLSRDTVESIDRGIVTGELADPDNIEVWQNFVYSKVTYSTGDSSLGRFVSMHPTKGTWTPELMFGGSSTGITYTTQSAEYVRVDDIVHIWCRIVLSSKGAETGTATIDGLPFTVSGSDSQENASGGAASHWENMASGTTETIVVSANGDGTTLRLTKSGGAGTVTDLTDADFTDTASISFSLSYRV